MNLIVEFYKSLDTLNLIIFWGIIIVIILLLIFSIILINKNKKLKQIIDNEKIDNNHADIPIQTKVISNQEKNAEEKIVNVEKEKNINIVTSSNNIISEEKTIEPEEEKNNEIKEEINFIAEEHVMEYNQNQFSNIENEITINKVVQEENNEINLPTGPYQRNVLRDLPSQTSPIGIIKPKNNELSKAKELKSLLTDEDNIEDETTNTESYINSISSKISVKPNDENIKERTSSSSENKIINNSKQTAKVESNKDSYLEKVKDSLSKAVENEDIVRTNYEKQQEEDAIISYEELMQKKDQIKIVDEEEAVISIEELMQKKEHKDKLYQLTEEEENDEFIKELKNFRHDL